MRTHQRMGVGSQRKGGLAEVVSGRGRRSRVWLGFEVLAPQRGMRGEDWPMRTKLRTVLCQA